MAAGPSAGATVAAVAAATRAELDVSVAPSGLPVMGHTAAALLQALVELLAASPSAAGAAQTLGCAALAPGPSPSAPALQPFVPR